MPVLAMLTAAPEELSARAERLRDGVGPAARVIKASARVGGGALPLLELSGPVCAVDPAPLGLDELAAAAAGRRPAGGGPGARGLADARPAHAHRRRGRRPRGR